MKFRAKPVIIEAIQWTGDNVLDVGDFLGNDNRNITWGILHSKKSVSISTLGGIVIAYAGDWIVKGVQGEFYPRKPEIFEQTYEPVSGMEGK